MPEPRVASKLLAEVEARIAETRSAVDEYRAEAERTTGAEAEIKTRLAEIQAAEKSELEQTASSLRASGFIPLSLEGALRRITALSNALAHSNGADRIVGTPWCRYRFSQNGVLQIEQIRPDPASGDNPRTQPAEAVAQIDAANPECDPKIAEKIMGDSELFLRVLAAWHLLDTGGKRQVEFPELSFAVRYDIGRRHLEIEWLENRNPILMFSEGILIRTHGEWRYIEDGVFQAAYTAGWRDPAVLEEEI